MKLILVCLLATAPAAVGSPVEKVVNLLKEMKDGLAADHEKEEKIYNMFACWCHDTTANKAKDIEVANDQMRALGQQILTYKGQIASLESEVEEFGKKIKDNLAEQAEATSIRQKENGEFQSETTEMKDTLVALQKAIIVLVNATAPGGMKEEFTLIQQQTAGVTAVKNVIEAMPEARFPLKPAQASLLAEFMGSTGTVRYAPQSMTVQGMLKDMYSTFAADLEKATFDEAMKNREFEDLMHTKAQELAADQASKALAEKRKAKGEEDLADTQQEFDESEKAKNADIEFFDATKGTCEAKHNAWEERSALRREEMAGIQKALDVLTSDEAREMFATSFSSRENETSFLQLKSVPADSDDDQLPAELRAYEALKRPAGKVRSLRLAALAAQVRQTKAGHFDKVIADINEMIQTLKDEGAADVKKRDQCKDEYQKIESTASDLKWKIKNNKAKVDKLEALIEKRQDEKADTERKIEDVKAQMKTMTADRKAENEAFLNAKSEDQETIGLLTQAKDALAAYYSNHSIDMGPIQGGVKDLALFGNVTEVSEFSDDMVPKSNEFVYKEAPEADFAVKESRMPQSKGVVSILTYLIEDLTDGIRRSVQEELDAQEQYEGLMAKAGAFKAELEEKKLTLKGIIAKRNSEKTAEEKVQKDNEWDLKDEMDYKAQITPDCEWMYKAFTPRAEARAAEMEGLTQAKAILSSYATNVKESFEQELKKSTGDYGGAAALLGWKPTNQKTSFLNMRRQN